MSGLVTRPDPFARASNLPTPKPPAGMVNRERQRAAAARLFAELGPDISMWRIRTAAGVSHGNGAGAYQTRDEVLGDILTEHVIALSNAVAVAQDDHARLAPAHLLERLIHAWLEAAARAPDAHRALLFCAHALPEQARRDLDLRLRITIELMQDAIIAAVPEIGAWSDAALLFYPLIRGLLCDPFDWNDRPEPGRRQTHARRLAGMLIAAAEAEATGFWPRCGAVDGAGLAFDPVTIDTRQARIRLRELLDAAELGADITITRRRKPVARVVRAR